MSLVDYQKFIFTWRIENFMYCHQNDGEALLSPQFTWQVDKENSTTWRLYLIPRSELDNNYVEFYLQFCKSDVGNVEASYDLKIVGLSGKLFKHTSADKQLYGIDVTENASKNHNIVTCLGYDKFAPRTRLTSNVDSWLTKGALVIRCEISATFNNTTRHTKTSTGVDSIKQHSLLDKGLACTEIVVDVFKSIHREQVSEHDFISFVICNNKCALICMRVKLKAKEKKLLIEIKRLNLNELKNFKSAFCTLKLLIYDSSGDTQYFGEYEHFFSKNDKTWEITIQTINYNTFLNKPVTFKTKFKISRGTQLSQLVYVSDKKSIFRSNNLRHFEKNILSMYTEQKSCDFTIVSADGKELKAHKSILQTRSAYFDKMLSFNSKELQENRVEIPDIDSETLDLLLRYIYSSYLEDYEIDVAMKVYAAADKYEMLDLKQHCSALMIGQLDLSNVFDVLKLADLYSDIVLESCVKTFIIENAVRVFESDEWNSIEDENPKLASRISKWVAIEQSKKLSNYD